MESIKQYLITLGETSGRAWTRFWFRGSDAFPLSVLRILVGTMALYFLLSHTADLVRWFGPHGMLPIETVRRLTGASGMTALGQAQSVFHYSLLNGIESPAALWTFHVLGCAVVLLFTVGLASRLTNVLSLVVVLSYVHRGPMLAGQFEPVLTMLLFYLCFAPAGAFLSLDRRFEKLWKRFLDGTFGESASSLAGTLLLGFAPRQAGSETAAPADEKRAEEKSVAATISLNLIQLHVAALCLTMGLTKLGGQMNGIYSATWWAGDAVWWLIAQTESRLVDLTFLHSMPYLINAWTHAIVLFELVFGLLIWVRVSRPLLLSIAAVMWTSLGLLTGLVAFCAVMLVAGLAFVPSESLRRAVASCFGRSENSAQTGNVKPAKNLAAISSARQRAGLAR